MTLSVPRGRRSWISQNKARTPQLRVKPPRAIGGVGGGGWGVEGDRWGGFIPAKGRVMGEIARLYGSTCVCVLYVGIHVHVCVCIVCMCERVCM